MTRSLRLVLLVIAGAALIVPALLVRFAPAPPRVHRAPHASRPAPVAPSPPPAVEPVALKDLTPDDARAFNGTIPFSADPNPAARPFRLPGAGPNADRARDCLAAAAYYEAGDDAVGERAVAQVVINRLRHPAFPKTVCGVVFQGSEKRTGCQFTFTCDGSIARRQPSDVTWARARAVATLALHGGVDRAVGWSTHYHTDWVVPYWQPSLEKLAEIHTQLFYRWDGWWGTAIAFTGRPAAAEPIVAALAPFSDAHRPPATSAPNAAGLPSEAGTPGADGNFLVAIPAGTPPDGWRMLAELSCGDRTVCRFLGWRDRKQVPASLPLTPDQAATLAFSYTRDDVGGVNRAQWDCRSTPRHDPRECLRPPLPAAAPTPTPSPTPSVAPTAPGDLAGIRHKD